MTARTFKCPCCGQDARTMDIEDPRDWIGTTESIEVLGSRFSSNITGEVRRVRIGGKEYQFLRREVQEHWPKLEHLIEVEDSMP